MTTLREKQNDYKEKTKEQYGPHSNEGHRGFVAGWDSFQMSPLFLAMKEALEFTKKEFEVINEKGHMHMTGWQMCRDILKEIEGG